MKRITTLFLLLFLSVSASAEFNSSGWNYQINGLNVTVNSTSVCEYHASQYPISWAYTYWEFIGVAPNGDDEWKCWHRTSNPCPNPEDTWNSETGECEAPPPDPCEQYSGQTVTMQFSPGGFPVSHNGCLVNQTSDSQCTGTASEGGTCVAQFTYSGTSDPGWDPNAPEDGTAVTSEQNPEDVTSSSSTSTGDKTTKSSTTDGSSTTEKTVTENGDGSKTVDEKTTTNNGDGTSTTTTTTTEIGADGSPTSVTQSQSTYPDANGDGEADAGSSTGGSNCKQPPVCQGDALQCAQILQQWRIQCGIGKNTSGTDDCAAAFKCEGDPIQCASLQLQRDRICSTASIGQDMQNEFINQGLTTDLNGVTNGSLLSEFGTDEKDLTGDLQNVFSATSSNSGSCPAPITINAGFTTVDVDFQLVCDLATTVRTFVILFAMIAAAYNIFVAIREPI